MPSDQPANRQPFADLATITGDENLLLLAPGPLDASFGCGGLIAGSCGRGRPPFVMVLADGTSQANGLNLSPDEIAKRHERETRTAMSHLGLTDERLLMAGLHDGQVPKAGPLFDAVVRAVTFVMWRRDCNVICAPWSGPNAAADTHATWRIAEAVAASSGVGLLGWVGDGTVPNGCAEAWRLDIEPQSAAKRRAVSAHAAVRVDAGEAAAASAWETFFRVEAASRTGR